MPRPGAAALAGPLAVLVAAAALMVAGLRPAAVPVEPEPPESRTVGADTTLCPAFPLGGGSDAAGTDAPGTVTAVGAVVVVSDTGGGGRGGHLRVAPFGAGSRPVVTLDRRGSWQGAMVPAGQASDLLVTSSAGFGAGSATYTAQRLPGTAGAGLAVERCAAPARQWWFVAAGSSAERESTLVLSNVDDGDAVVDVVLRGADGPLEASGTSGVRVAAGERVRLPLSGLVAGEDEVAIEVDATQGRVVAAVADDWSGVEAAGSDWLPASPTPARTVLLPGVPGHNPRSRLVVANAAESSTPVTLSVVDDSGTFVPTNAPRLLAPAGGVESVPLPGVGHGAGLLLQADTPLTAAVRVRTGPGTRSDIGYAVQGPQLDGPAVVPVDLGRGIPVTGLRLHLAAALGPDVGSGTETPPARSATVTAFDADGVEVGSTAVEVAAGTATVVDPSGDLDLDASDRAGAAYLVVTPDHPAARAGGLFGTAVLRGDGGGVALLPLETGLVRVDVPAVTPAVVPPPG